MNEKDKYCKTPEKSIEDGENFDHDKNYVKKMTDPEKLSIAEIFSEPDSAYSENVDRILNHKMVKKESDYNLHINLNTSNKDCMANDIVKSRQFIDWQKKVENVYAIAQNPEDLCNEGKKQDKSQESLKGINVIKPVVSNKMLCVKKYRKDGSSYIQMEERNALKLNSNRSLYKPTDASRRKSICNPEDDTKSLYKNLLDPSSPRNLMENSTNSYRNNQLVNNNNDSGLRVNTQGTENTIYSRNLDHKMMIDNLKDQINKKSNFNKTLVSNSLESKGKTINVKCSEDIRKKFDSINKSSFN